MFREDADNASGGMWVMKVDKQYTVRLAWVQCVIKVLTSCWFVGEDLARVAIGSYW